MLIIRYLIIILSKKLKCVMTHVLLNSNIKQLLHRRILPIDMFEIHSLLLKPSMTRTRRIQAAYNNSSHFHQNILTWVSASQIMFLLLECKYWILQTFLKPGNNLKVRPLITGRALPRGLSGFQLKITFGIPLKYVHYLSLFILAHQVLLILYFCWKYLSLY